MLPEKLEAFGGSYPDIRRRLPAMTALLYFESAAKHLSFSRAAEDLNVTQGAVSRQIRALEKQLGLKLFYRLHKTVELTEAGRRLLPSITSALDHLGAGIDEATVDSGRYQITIAASTSASNGLISALPDLYESCPGIGVHILASNQHLENIPDQFDVGVVFGLNRQSNFKQTFLAHGEVFPVCSPAYLEEVGGVCEPEFLLSLPLLHSDDNHRYSMDWPFWFRAIGVDGRPRHARLRVNNNLLLIKAAIKGQGVALAWNQHVAEYLNAGVLVKACNRTVKTKQSFSAIVKTEQGEDPNLKLVVEWLSRYFSGRLLDKKD